MAGNMSVEEMFALARETMNSEVELYEEPLPGEGEGVYVCEMVMGGRALMVAPDGGVLFADSSTSFEEQLEAFRQGIRTPLSVRADAEN